MKSYKIKLPTCLFLFKCRTDAASAKSSLCRKSSWKPSILTHRSVGRPTHYPLLSVQYALPWPLSQPNVPCPHINAYPFPSSFLSTSADLVPPLIAEFIDLECPQQEITPFSSLINLRIEKKITLDRLSHSWWRLHKLQWLYEPRQ